MVVAYHERQISPSHLPTRHDGVVAPPRPVPDDKETPPLRRPTRRIPAGPRSTYYAPRGLRHALAVRHNDLRLGPDRVPNEPYVHHRRPPRPRGRVRAHGAPRCVPEIAPDHSSIPRTVDASPVELSALDLSPPPRCERGRARPTATSNRGRRRPPSRLPGPDPESPSESEWITPRMLPPSHHHHHPPHHHHGV